MLWMTTAYNAIQCYTQISKHDAKPRQRDIYRISTAFCVSGNFTSEWDPSNARLQEHVSLSDHSFLESYCELSIERTASDAFSARWSELHERELGNAADPTHTHTHAPTHSCPALSPRVSVRSLFLGARPRQTGPPPRLPPPPPPSPLSTSSLRPANLNEGFRSTRFAVSCRLRLARARKQVVSWLVFGVSCNNLGRRQVRSTTPFLDPGPMREIARKRFHEVEGTKI